ncbi:dolichyl-phosphate-mannose--protein mannosyltransferase [Leptospira paudalimensis]|uniref:Dolichyl-phosphate-mannose--protein mannosyltransferase n=1 Tax=Leptospira paudalimensis TaxID=2950024 RepID=A0ABT3M6X1_9LEPT|nr:dolichyl-phosphate-mannose--protein mannosyltransferase [Leptospira paudalimensis]MCW7503776.1 dolichyl-phosphate-mannose--protein mannosyltransferase [Leptospira paudalimensis]
MKINREGIKKFKFEIGIFISLAIGIFFRFYKLDRQSLWTDELYSVYASSLENWHLFWDYLASDPHPPLFQILLSIWIHINPTGNEIYIKFFPVIISILNLLLLLFLTRGWEKKRRFLFLFLFSFSPGAIYYAQEVRSYSLLLCLSSSIIVLFDSFLSNLQNKKRYVLLAILSICISYVHLFGFIFVGSLYFLFWIYFYILKDNRSYWIFLLGLVTFVAYLPFIFQLLSGDKIATAGWIDPPNLVLYLSYYSLFFYTSKKFLFLTVIVPVLLFLILIYRLAKKILGKGGFYSLRLSELYLLVSFFIIIVTSFFSFYKPIVTNRNWIVTLPLVYMFVSEKLSENKRSNILIVSLILLTIFSFIDFKKNFYIVFKEDWRSTTQFISRQCEGKYVFSNATPEYIKLYLNWNSDQKFEPKLLGEETTIEQKKLCVVYRFLDGNGKSFQEENGWKFVKENTFYGMVVKEYLRSE